MLDKTAKEILHICADELEEIGSHKLAERLRRMSVACDMPIVLSSTYAESRFQDLEPIGILHGEVHHVEGRERAREEAVRELQWQALQIGVTHLFTLRVAHRPVGDPEWGVYYAHASADAYA